MDKMTLTITELCEQLSISRTTAYRLTKLKDFPVVEIGSGKRIDTKRLEKWLANGGASKLGGKVG